MEWGCGNGNLAACFLSHLKTLDKDGLVYPRVRYLFVDNQPALLRAALAHPDLAPHRERVWPLCADVLSLGAVKDASVDRIVCNELWNELPTKLLLRKDGEIEEEYLRPNLSAATQAAIADWPGFLRAFGQGDVRALKEVPPFLEDIIWEREYRKIEWKTVPFRKTITEFLKKIDEKVLVPINLGACTTVKEAKRLLAPEAVGFSSFDAGTADFTLLNDPDKPCYSQVGGQYSFLVNFALIESVARHLGIGTVTQEPQREFVGRSLGTRVLSLMDLLAMHPSSGSLKGWEQDRLILKTIGALNEAYRSPYQRRLEYPLPPEVPGAEREELERLLGAFRGDGVPDTIAYLTEAELVGAMERLEALGYEREAIRYALEARPQPVEYAHWFLQA
ncbi:class I SAM-dependent methyltransferase [Nitrospira sp. Kam-Ns4a]